MLRASVSGTFPVRAGDGSLLTDFANYPFPDRSHRPGAGVSAAGRLRRRPRPDRRDRAGLPARGAARCLIHRLRKIHRLRNVLAKIPAGMQAEIRDGYSSVVIPGH
jgi:hypothetical protein